mmetsp:Transcript_26929/g.58821  ORF Transcript_26929/g.58821 Transcript_26929/m.58821 type:complete len:382 (-) Transcript_26929:1703-2848(-)|eukprot:CAMPEP_0202891800 /NCGR_PEP_ID=MMETSP1392-20130828/1766_1 /ASSEMBLY_ACC=CAM_ASM_000868 /TAXON_ID=225041 /ORGANISM="Chlamydomonas chlamydogama, Strain SAG 11-48b" /LENGTH=381 /DNA_ID=CAMNT_0049575655 /DNA_START=226 /DNA_END=1371 /DNA_ORIENTATION=+
MEVPTALVTTTRGSKLDTRWDVFFPASFASSHEDEDAGEDMESSCTPTSTSSSSGPDSAPQIQRGTAESMIKARDASRSRSVCRPLDPSILITRERLSEDSTVASCPIISADCCMSPGARFVRIEGFQAPFIDICPKPKQQQCDRITECSQELSSPTTPLLRNGSCRSSEESILSSCSSARWTNSGSWAAAAAPTTSQLAHASSLPATMHLPHAPIAVPMRRSMGSPHTLHSGDTGSPVLRSPVAGSPVLRNPVAGSPVLRSPVSGSPVGGSFRRSSSSIIVSSPVRHAVAAAPMQSKPPPDTWADRLLRWLQGDAAPARHTSQQRRQQTSQHPGQHAVTAQRRPDQQLAAGSQTVQPVQPGAPSWQEVEACWDAKWFGGR